MKHQVLQPGGPAVETSADGRGTQRPPRVVLHDENCQVLNLIIAQSKRACVRYRGGRLISYHRQPDNLHDKHSADH